MDDELKQLGIEVGDATPQSASNRKKTTLNQDEVATKATARASSAALAPAKNGGKGPQATTEAPTDMQSMVARGRGGDIDSASPVDEDHNPGRKLRAADLASKH